MRYTIVLVLFSFLASCSTAKKASKAETIESFSQEIVQATKKHNYKKMVKLLEKDFYVMQLIEIHENNTVNFANEFFCGDYKGKYKCMVFEDISDIKVKKIGLTGNNNYKVTFEVTNKKNETIQTSNCWVKKTMVDNKPVFKMFGPAG